MQAARIGLLVHRRGLLERAAVGDVDAQLPLVDATDQPGELGGVQRLLGLTGPARENLETVVREAASLDKRESHRKALLGLSAFWCDRGQLARSENLLNELEGAEDQVDTLLVRSEIALHRGALEDALRGASRAALAAKELKRPFALARALRREITLQLRIGCIKEARRSLVVLLSSTSSNGLDREQGWARFLEGLAFSTQGRTEAAEKFFAQGLELLMKHGNRRDLVRLYLPYGLFNLRGGNLERAYLDLQEGLFLARRLDLPYMLSWYLIARGCLERAFADSKADKVREFLLEAERLAAGAPYPEPLWLSRYHLARLCADQGRFEESRQYRRLAREAGGPLLERLSRRHRDAYLRRMEIWSAPEGDSPSAVLTG